MESIAQNLAAIQKQIAATCQRVGRDPASVTLVAVTKQQSPRDIVATLQAGVTHIGENRVEEALPKMQQVEALLPPDVPPPTWHMVGHIQRRKAQAVIRGFQIIHSLDSIKLARRYDRFARELNRRPQVLLEINVSGEDTKAGIPAHNWQQDRTQRQSLWEIIADIDQLEHVHLAGLMTMAPFVAEIEQARPVFAALRRLRDALAEAFPHQAWHELSMGMTNDYPIAIEEGATMLRIGRAIFGDRF